MALECITVIGAGAREQDRMFAGAARKISVQAAIGAVAVEPEATGNGGEAARLGAAGEGGAGAAGIEVDDDGFFGAQGSDPAGCGVGLAAIAPGDADIIGDGGDLLIGQDRAEARHRGLIRVPGREAAEHHRDQVVGAAIPDRLIMGQVGNVVGDTNAVILMAARAFIMIEDLTGGEGTGVAGGGERTRLGFDGAQVIDDVANIVFGQAAETIIDDGFHFAEGRALGHVAIIVQIGEQSVVGPSADAILFALGDVRGVPGLGENRAAREIAAMD